MSNDNSAIPKDSNFAEKTHAHTQLYSKREYNETFSAAQQNARRTREMMSSKNYTPNHPSRAHRAHFARNENPPRSVWRAPRIIIARQPKKYIYIYICAWQCIAHVFARDVACGIAIRNAAGRQELGSARKAGRTRGNSKRAAAAHLSVNET